MAEQCEHIIDEWMR